MCRSRNSRCFPSKTWQTTKHTSLQLGDASDDVLTRPVVVNSEEPPEAEPVEILAPNLNFTINNVLL